MSCNGGLMERLAGIQYEDMAYTVGLGFATVGGNNVSDRVPSFPVSLSNFMQGS